MRATVTDYWICSSYFFFAELPITFVTPLADVHVYEKDEARFECEISRQPKSFCWLKGSQEITPDDKFEVLQEGKRHILVIKSASFEDEAKYLFETEDKRTSAKLVIQGKGEKIIHYFKKSLSSFFSFFSIKF